jgi:hypothetical protein
LLSFILGITQIKGDSKLPTTLKQGKLKEKMAARGARWTEKGGMGGDAREKRLRRKILE